MGLLAESMWCLAVGVQVLFFFERLFPPSDLDCWNPQIVEGIGGHFHRSTGSRV